MPRIGRSPTPAAVANMQSDRAFPIVTPAASEANTTLVNLRNNLSANVAAEAVNKSRTSPYSSAPGGYASIRWDGFARCRTAPDCQSCLSAGCSWTSWCPKCQGQCFPEGTGEGVFRCSLETSLRPTKQCVDDTTPWMPGKAFGCEVRHTCVPKPTLSERHYQGHGACVNGCTPEEAVSAREWRAWFCDAQQDDEFCRTRALGSAQNEPIFATRPDGSGSIGVPVAAAQFVEGQRLVKCWHTSANHFTDCQTCGGKVSATRGCTACGLEAPFQFDFPITTPEACKPDAIMPACGY